MSKHQVVAEYLAGRIDRREFIVKLTTAGVSTAAAIAYAETFSQSVAARGAGKDARGYVTAFQGTADYPITDFDGDGFTDDEETNCGSDPNNPDSTCDNVGDGGGDGGGTGSFSFTIPIDITINLPGGVTIVIGAGSTISFANGVLSFNGTINGQPASFSATFTLLSAVNSGAALRALASDVNLSFVVNEFTSWNVPGVDQPETPLNVTVSGSGGVYTVTINGVVSNITVTSGLPNTGVGGSGDKETTWIAPLAIAGAGLAVLSRRFRGAKQSS